MVDVRFTDENVSHYIDSFYKVFVLDHDDNSLFKWRKL
jgi:hypothetical protein